MAATRRLQKELLDIRREEKETVSIILMSSVRNSLLLFGLNFMCSVADPYHFDADPDPYPACHFNPDPDPSSQIKAQNLEVLKKAHFSYIFGL
jgi:hypothetical protein